MTPGESEAWIAVTDPATGTPTVYHVYDGLTVNVEIETDHYEMDGLSRPFSSRTTTLTITCRGYEVLQDARVYIAQPEPPARPTRPATTTTGAHLDRPDRPADHRPEPQRPAQQPAVEPAACTNWCCN